MPSAIPTLPSIPFSLSSHAQYLAAVPQSLWGWAATVPL